MGILGELSQMAEAGCIENYRSYWDNERKSEPCDYSPAHRGSSEAPRTSGAHTHYETEMSRASAL